MKAQSRPATIIDVARDAGVSKSTVARALTDSGSVSSETRVRVRDSAARLGYRPNTIARSMITRTTRTIGVVLPDLGNSYFSAALQGISATARSSGFEVVVSSTERDAALERSAVRLLVSKRVDGLVVAPEPDAVNPELAEAMSGGLPVVLLDRPSRDLPDVSSVSVANIASSRAAMGHLLGLGHRTIAIVSDVPFDPRLAEVQDDSTSFLLPGHARMSGYLQSLTAAGLPLRPELVASTSRTSDSAAAATTRLLAEHPDVTAIYCTYNVLSVGALQALQDLGVRCPDEMSIIGFDDHEWATLVRPRFTVVAQPTEQLGRTAAVELLDMIADRERRPVRHVLDARLVVRESTGRARAGALSS